ncbi:MAG: HAD family hydrolase [Paraclostridium sp.]
MDIKLIVSDIDGTLIGTDENLKEEFHKLKDFIKNNNIPFTLATGRCYNEVKDFINEFEVELPIVVNNGAGTVKDGDFIGGTTMKASILRKAIECADELGMVIVTSDGISDKSYRHNDYIRNQIEKFGRYEEIYRPSEDEWGSASIQKLLIIDPLPDGRVDSVLKHLEPYKDMLNIVKYNDRSVDIMPALTNKAQGVANIAKLLDIDVSQIMAIGDAKNDIEMINTVGVGVAVSNADSKLKEVANYVCDFPNAGGVLEAVKKFYKL